MAMKKVTYCNWWGYIVLRIRFRRRCADKGVQYDEIYKAPNRYLYCKSHRAVMTRYGNVWEKKQPVYVSTFCDNTRCDHKGTCANCEHNLDNIETK